MAGPKRIDDAPVRSLVREVEDDAESDATETSQMLGARKDSRHDINDFESLPPWRRPSVFWLLGPYAVFTLAFGGTIVPKLNLILDLVCKQYFADQQLNDPGFSYKPVILGTDNPQCKIPEVQRNVASFMLVMNLVIGVLSAIVAPKLGHMSDRYGRLRLMALASFGGLMSELVTILAARFPQAIDYRWLILGSVFDGVTGSFTASNILSQSYTSDCTPPSKRAVSIGYVHACLFTGLAFGPIFAGYFVKWTGSLVSFFYVAAACHAFFILAVVLVIPESLSKRKQLIAREKWAREKEARAYQPGSWLSKAQASNPLASLRILWPTGPGTSSRLRINLVALAITDTIIMGALISVGSVIIIYSEYMFNWGNFEASRFVSALSMVRVVVLMGIFPIINYFVRIRPAARRRRESGLPLVDKNSGADNLDIWILRAALISDVVGCLGYTFARSGALFVGSGMMTAIGGLGSATVQAAVTKHVPADRVGQLLGAIGMMHALSRIVGPVMFNGLYAMTVGTFPQAIFVLLVALFGVGLVCTFMVKPHVHWEDDEEDVDLQGAADQTFGSTTARAMLGEEQGLIP